MKETGVPSKDRQVLRELAAQVAEIAGLPAQQETIRLWKALNGLRPVRPMVAVTGALAPGPVGLLVGPEGGFSEAELDELAGHPLVVAIGLGPRVLRAETAAMAALACWQAHRGDWTTGDGRDQRPPFRDSR